MSIVSPPSSNGWNIPLSIVCTYNVPERWCKGEHGLGIYIQKHWVFQMQLSTNDFLRCLLRWIYLFTRIKGPSGLVWSGLTWPVLVCVRLFRSVLGCFCLFWAVLVYSDLWGGGGGESSGLFWSVLVCIGLFWSVWSIWSVLVYSDLLMGGGEESWSVLVCSCLFWSVLAV